MNEFELAPPVLTAGSKHSPSNKFLEFDAKGVTLYRREQRKNTDSQTKIKQVALSGFLKRMLEIQQEDKIIETPPLPEGSWYYARGGENGALIIEQPPQTRTIKWSGLKSYEVNKRGAERYNLAFPYVVFICRIENEFITEVFVFYRNSALTSLDDELYRTNFANITDKIYQRICLGGKIIEGSLIQQAGIVLDRMWNSSFNDDLGSGEFNSGKMIDKRLSSLKKWEMASAIDEFFMLNLSWMVAYKTVREAVKQLCFSGLREKAISTFDDLLDVFYCCAPESREKQPFFYQRQTPDKIGEYPEDYHDMPNGGGFPCG